MTAWTVRRAGAADASALSLVAGATLLETFHTIIPVADMVAHVARKSSAAVFADWIGDASSTVFYAGAEATDAPLGYAVLTTPDFPIATGPGDVELRRIYILSASQGSGLGKALMNAATEWSRVQKRVRMLLGVHSDNLRARRFYERTGFCVIGEREFLVGKARFIDPIYALDL